MQLEKGKRSVLAYFPSSSKAKTAINELKSAGIKDISFDRVSRYGVEADREYNNPIAGQAYTMTGLTLFSADTDGFGDNDARVLLANDPSAYSMAAHDYGAAGGKSFLVTVVTTEDKLPVAENILKKHDAYF